MNRTTSSLTMIAAALFVPATVLHAADGSKAAANGTSPADEQLGRMLKRFPEADANKDGILTREEALEFRKKMQSGGSAVAGKKARKAFDGPKPDFADLAYGPHPNNKLDLWLAKADKPTPLVVFIHGGGFVGGDKSSASSVILKQCLDAGVSFAAINYRFRTEASINVVLRDSARAIQFLRYKAEQFNLDKQRVAAYGGSAGAGTSLWLAFHDDLADPKSDDPVLRESTRLSAAAASACQATYDILKWRDVLGSDEAMRFYPQSSWPGFYGLQTLDDLQTEKGKQLRADVDMLGLISKDDPPVWLGAGAGHDALANKGDTNHSPKHSEAVKRRCDEVGVSAVLKIGNAVRGDSAGNQSQIEFLLKHLGAAASAPRGDEMAGLVWMVGKNRGERLDGAEIEKVLDANPHISGVFPGGIWRELEPARGALDWKPLDAAVEAARRKGRFYKLSFMPGTGTPDWVYSAGAAVFETLGSNPHRTDTYQKPVRIPVPWDPVYLREFARFLVAAGKRYAGDPLCAAVAITGANFQSDEAHLPKGPKDIERWEALGYREKLPKAYERYTDIFAEAFPRQQLCLHISVAVHNNDGVMEKAVAYGARRYPDRFTLQNCQLNGRNDNSGLYSYALIQQYAGKLHIGFQSLAYLAEGERGARMDDPRRAVANFVRGRGEYWELWDGNGRDPVICKWLLDEISRARSQAAKTP